MFSNQNNTNDFLIKCRQQDTQQGVRFGTTDEKTRVAKLYNNRVVEMPCRNLDVLIGSSSFVLVDGVLKRKSRKKNSVDLCYVMDRVFQLERLKKTDIPYLAGLCELEEKYLNPKKYAEFSAQIKQEAKEYAQRAAANLELQQYEDALQGKGRKPRSPLFKLNKKKIIDRAMAFAQTSQAQKFLAFYSVSFPSHLSEDVIYTMWKNWLRNCKKNHGLKNYLWVSEYQDNGTLHFHMLTSEFLDIRTVNYSMAMAIDNQAGFTDKETMYYNRKKNTWVKGVCTRDNYNGCDVVEVYGDRTRVISYMTKYMTKGERQYLRQPWHCTRSISALAVGQNINYSELQAIEKEMDVANLPFEKRSFDYCSVTYINIPTDAEKVDKRTGEITKKWYMLPVKYYALLRRVNQFIFDLFQGDNDLEDFYYLDAPRTTGLIKKNIQSLELELQPRPCPF